MSDFADFFNTATGFAPYPFQSRIAQSQLWPLFLEVPTGVGKTEAIVLPWLWRRSFEAERQPRRLIYALPMRSLVEQTRERIEVWLDRLNNAGYGSVELVSQLGGEAPREWYELPEGAAILIGTQDMLLSRALNRGYAMSRFQWPMAFGALNNDVLWVVDEVQLQGIGAVTAAQLQGMREKLGVYGQTATVFASATIEREWIDSVDHKIEPRLAERGAVMLNDDDLTNRRVRDIVDAPKVMGRIAASDERGVAAAVVERHVPRSMTLVILNRVDRARRVAAELRKQPGVEVLLLHSRFRPPDRRRLLDRLRALDGNPGEGAIVVATQVVEAGVDVSARTLISDLAPWSSIVQRLGRCNRRGEYENSTFGWIDGGEPNLKNSLPYDASQLVAARGLLRSLEGESLSPSRLYSLKAPSSLVEGLTLRRSDLLDLFDTSADLSGNDVDVSRFIRADDGDAAFVFWRLNPPDSSSPPRREELCPAPAGDVDKMGKEERGRVLVADPLARSAGDHRWISLTRRVKPGEMVFFESRIGCYSSDEGFDVQLKGRAMVEPVSPSNSAATDGSVDDDELACIGAAVSLEEHSEDTAREASALVVSLSDLIPAAVREAVVTAARWHDVGKAHDVFQDTMRRSGVPTDGGPWAKGIRRARHQVRFFRHELASALAWLSAQEYRHDLQIDLIAYLVAAHHGKVRVTAQRLPGESNDSGRRLLGVAEGDTLPSVNLGSAIVSPAAVARLALFDVGIDDPDLDLAATWADRALGLRDAPEIGPFRLAYLEALVRIADWRASAYRRGSPTKDVAS